MNLWDAIIIAPEDVTHAEALVNIFAKTTAPALVKAVARTLVAMHVLSLVVILVTEVASTVAIEDNSIPNYYREEAFIFFPAKFSFYGQ